MFHNFLEIYLIKNFDPKLTWNFEEKSIIFWKVTFSEAFGSKIHLNIFIEFKYTWASNFASWKSWESFITDCLELPGIAAVDQTVWFKWQDRWLSLANPFEKPVNRPAGALFQTFDSKLTRNCPNGWKIICQIQFVNYLFAKCIRNSQHSLSATTRLLLFVCHSQTTIRRLPFANTFCF